MPSKECYLDQGTEKNCPVFHYRDMTVCLFRDSYFLGNYFGEEYQSNDNFRERLIGAKEDGLNYATVVWANLVQAFAGNITYIENIRGNLEHFKILEEFLKESLLYYSHDYEYKQIQNEEVMEVPLPSICVLAEVSTINKEAAKFLLDKNYTKIVDSYFSKYGEDPTDKLFHVDKDFEELEIRYTNASVLHDFLEKYREGITIRLIGGKELDEHSMKEAESKVDTVINYIKSLMTKSQLEKYQSSNDLETVYNFCKERIR